MDLTQGALLTSVAANFLSLYGVWRATRTKAREADAAVDVGIAKANAEIEDGAIDRWQEFAAKLEGKLERQEKELEAMRIRELECAKQSARQEEQIAHLSQAVRGLRADLKRAGIHPSGSGDHEPVKG